MAEKRYYWLKLQRDFFKRHDMRIIEEMENGKDYLLFYLKLLVESIDHEGRLRFSDTVPYNEKMLSVVTNTNIDIVRDGLEVLKEFGLVEVLPDKTFLVRKAKRGARDRSSKEYRIWRQSVFERDDYTCQICHKRGEKINAHHIKEWYAFPQERYNVENGITLCEECHREYHRNRGISKWLKNDISG